MHAIVQKRITQLCINKSMRLHYHLLQLAVFGDGRGLLTLLFVSQPGLPQGQGSVYGLPLPYLLRRTTKRKGLLQLLVT